MYTLTHKTLVFALTTMLVLSFSLLKAGEFEFFTFTCDNNVIQDGDLESNDIKDFWNDTGNLWRTGEPNNVYSGDKAIGMNNNNGLAGIFQKKPASSGQYYTLSAYAKSTSGNGDVGIRFLDSNSDIIVDLDNDVASATYQEYTSSGSAPSGTAYVQAYARITGSGTFFVDAFCLTLCDNVSSGGSIGVDQSTCGASYDPEVIQSISLPSGGSGDIEYLWLKSTTTCTAPNGSNDSEWNAIPGADGPSYNPPSISQTTCYLRCSRRSGCEAYDGESNVVTVDLFGDGIQVDIPEDNTVICGSDEIVLQADISAASSCGEPGESDCNHSLEDYGGWVESPGSAAYCGQNYGAKLWTKAGDGTSYVTIDFGEVMPSGTKLYFNMKLEHCSGTSSDYSDAKLSTLNAGSSTWTTLASSLTFQNTNYNEFEYTMTQASRYVKVRDNGKCAFKVDYIRTETAGSQNNSVTFSWSGPGIVGANDQSTVTVNSAGTYTVTASDCTGCQATDNIVITGSSVVANAGPDMEVCPGESVTLNGNVVSGASYAWRVQGSTSVVSTSSSLTVTADGNNIYIYTVTKNGCEDSDEVEVTSTDNLSVTLASAGPFCEGDASSQLLGSPTGGTYSGTGVSSNGLFTPLSATIGSNIITYTYTNGSGCSGSDQIDILVNNGPDLTLNAPITNICAGETISIGSTVSDVASCGSNGESDCNHSVEGYSNWIESPGKAAICGDGQGAKLWTQSGEGVSSIRLDFGTIVPAGTVICVKMKLEHCSNTSSSSSDAKIQASLSSNSNYSNLTSSVTFSNGSYQEFCYTLTSAARYVKVSDNGKCAFRVDYVEYTTPTTQNSDITYNWSGPGIVGSNDQATINANVAGTYTLTVTDCTGCSASEEIEILGEGITASAGIDQEVCVGEQVTLTAASVSGATYEWRIQGNSTILSSQQNYSFEPSVSATYILTVQKDDCADTDDVHVTVLEAPSITNLIYSNSNCDNQGSITIFFDDHASRTNLRLSLDGGSSYPYNFSDNISMFTVDNVADGAYNLFISWGDEDCPTGLGSITISDECNQGDYFINLVDETFIECTNLSLSKDVSTNDSYNSIDGVEEYSLISTPASGSLNFNTDGTFTYSNTIAGTFEFTYGLCISKYADTPPTEVCQGGIDEMDVMYEGPSGVSIIVSNKSGASVFATFSNVQNGQVLHIENNTGTYNGQFNNWKFEVNGSENALVHTSCSVPILGRTFGDFYILGYNSVNGGSNSMMIEVCEEATATIIFGDTEITIEGIGSQCVNGDPIQLVANPQGGTFTGNGVNSSGLFDPASAGLGNTTITYSYEDTNGCTAEEDLVIQVQTCEEPANIDVFNDCGSDLSFESTIKGLMGGVSSCMNVDNAANVNRIIAEVWIETGDCNNYEFPAFVTLSFDGSEFNVPGITVIQSANSSVPEKLYRYVYTGSATNVCLVDGNGCDATSLALYIERNDPNASSSLMAYNQELDTGGSGNDDCIMSVLKIGDSDLPRDIKIDIPIHEKDNTRSVEISVTIKDGIGNVIATDTKTFTTQNAGIEAAIYSMMLEDVAGEGVNAEVTICSPANTGDSFGIGAVTVTSNEGCVECNLAGSVSDDDICQGEAATLTASYSSNNGGVEYAWSNGESTASIVVSPSTTTTYTVTITDSEGCTAEDEGTVTVNDAPTVSIEAAGPFCTDDSAVQLSGTPSGGTYSGSGVISSGLFDPASAQIGNNIITYTYSSPDGCAGSSQTTIVVDETADAGSISGDEQNCGSYDGGEISSSTDPSGSNCAGIVVTGADCCDDGDKPVSMSLIYNGESCASSNNGQGSIGGKWDCNGDPAGDANVYISVNNGQFSGNVSLNQAFLVENGGSSLSNPIEVSIFSENGGTLLQTVEIHTSCSVPIVTGDQFGSLVLAATEFDDGFSCGSSEALSIQWQQKMGAGAWRDIDGANGNTYNPGIIYNTTQFRRVATNCCGSDFSNVVTKTVFPNIFANAGSDQEICAGFSVDLMASVGLSGEANGFILKAQPESTSSSNIKFKKDGSTGPRLLVYTNGNSTPTILLATQVARIESENDDHNHDDPKVGYDGDEYDRTLVDFDLGSISGTIDQAKLVLLSESSNSVSVGAFAAPTEWNGEEVTWNRSDVGVIWDTPGGIESGANVLDVQSISGQGDVMWDVTGVVDSWVNGNSGNTGNYTYVWNNGLGGGANHTVTPSATTTYTVTVTDSNGCSDTDQVTVEVTNEDLEPGEIGSDQANCGGFDPELIASLVDPSGVCDISTEEDCCDSGDKPTTFTLFYNGESCAESQNSQGSLGGKWDCNGDANGDEEVYISANNGQFAGLVNINNSFTVSNGGNNLSNPVVLSVFSSQGGSLLQTIEIHTSCSAPIVAGDQFGSLILLATEFENGYTCESINGTLLVQWQVEVNSTWEDIAGATGFSYDPPFLDETTKYRREVSNCCGSEFSNVVTITVNDAVDVTLDPAGPFCQDADAVQLNGSPSGGEYSGTGVNTDGLFTPSLANIGANTITYSFENGDGCSETATIEIIVNPTPDVTLDPAGPLCLDAEAIQLTASPEGGSFEGNGVSSSGVFDPSIAGIGISTITYSYTDDNGCSNSATTDIIVNDVPVVSIDPAGPLCVDADAVQLTASPAGGDFSGPGVSEEGIFDPSVSGAGTFTITYDYSDGNNCSGSATVDIVVSELPTVTIDPAGPLCLDANAIQLTASPAGGSFSGTGVSPTGEFDPSEAGAGTTSITYNFTDGNKCASSATVNIVVNELPVVTANANPDPVCSGGSVELTATGSGGEGNYTYVWSDGLGVGSIVNVDNVTESTTYAVTVTDGAGCTATTTVDVNVAEKATVGDFVFLDKNADGVQDDGENGIDGVTVTLYNVDGEVAGSTTTVDGAYSFEVCAGEYYIIFGEVAELNRSPKGATTNDLDSDANADTGQTDNFVLEAGDNNEDIDAGYYGNASIGDFVFLDANADGIQDDDEVGVDGVTVNLKDAGGNVIATTTTANGGAYEFTGLTPGDYNVQFVLPANNIFSPLNASGDEATDSDANPAMNGMTDVVTLESGENNDDLDAGIFENASIGDYVWLDANANGIQDDNEIAVASVMVNLKDENGEVIATTSTNGLGKYIFDGLTPGTYSVQFVLPADGQYSPVNIGDDETVDSDADPAMDGMTEAVTLVSGDVYEDLDAGIYFGASIGDYVFLDADADGIQDDDEVGVDGITVNLKDEDGNVIATTITANGGAYEFTGLTPGDYSVQFVLSAGNEFSPLNASGDEATDSDADPAMDGMTEVVTLTSAERNNDLDAGIFEPASIGDFVFLDANADGIQDDGEDGIQGVPVSLTDADGNAVASTTTGINGEYSFTNLVPGDYIVVFGTPAGFNSSPANQGGDDALDSDAVDGLSPIVNLSSGEDDSTIDAGFYEGASIGDYVFLDTNADGVQDDDEVGVDGVTVNLKDEDGNVIATTQTANGGAYEFTGLVPGDYSVQFVIPTGNDFSPLNASGDEATDSDADPAMDGMTEVVTLTSGESNDDLDAGLFEPASIGDFVFLDANADGIQDDGEEGIQGVPVSLTDADGNAVASTTTGINGEYSFTNLVPGDYIVVFGTPAGFESSPANQGGDDALDSDAVDGSSPVVNLSSGENNSTVDAGFYEGASIGDFVFLDADADGIQDDDEVGVDGVTVNLKDEDGNVIATTETTNGGAYEFTGLVPGDYSVQFVITAGNVFSPLNASGDEATDSDADPAMNGMTEVVTLTSGESNDDLDAGLFEPASIGDYVWEDKDNNGLQDDIDSAIEGATVSLTDENGDPVQDVDGNPVNSELTGTDGAYEFTNLLPGDYIVVFTTPTGFEPAKSNIGDDDSNDSDAVGGSSPVVNLSSGENDDSIDAGFFMPSSIGDFVFLDSNANGIQDNDEIGVDGVTVNLKDADGNVISTTMTANGGAYEFTGLAPGDYSVQFVLPAGNAFSPLNASGDEATDSDADPAMDGMTETVTLESGVSNDDLDAGLFEPASVGDYVFNDVNNDGIQDDGDAPLQGVTVSLTDSDGNSVNDIDGNPVMDITSGNDGSYLFDNLVPGDYIVVFTAPDNFDPTIQDQGGATGDEGDTNTDSDINANGESYVVTLSSGETEEDVDAGFSSVADLNLVKRVSEIFPNVGDIITFNIIVENDGPNNATGVSIGDVIPNGYSSISNISNGGEQSGSEILWSDLSVPAFGMIEVTFDATVVAPGDDIDYVNIAKIETSDQFDPDSTPGDDADTDGDGIIGSEDFDGRQDPDDQDDGDEAWVEPQVADISLIKTVSNATPLVGDAVTFTIEVFNSGTSNATGVVVSDFVPNGYSNISTISNGGSVDEGTITWSDLSINALTSVELTFSVTVVAPADGIDYVNVAQVEAADQYDPDSEPGNPADSSPGNGIGSEDDDGTQDLEDEDDGDDAEVTPLSPSIDVEKYTNGFDSDVAPGKLILFFNGTEKDVEWTYDVTNTGDADLINVTVVDDIEGLICTIDELKVGETQTCSKIGIVLEGQYANIATATGTPVDPNTGNPSDIDVEDEDPSHYVGVRFNIEQVVSEEVVCAGDEVQVDVAVRLYPTGNPNIDPFVDFRDIRFNSEGLMEVLDVNSQYFNDASDPNGDGILTTDEFEFLWSYPLIITETSKFKVTDTFDVFFNGEFSQTMTSKDSIMVNVDPALCASLGNLVWFDADADGVKDAAEDGINGITVNLYLNSDPGTVFMTTTTAVGPGANDGYYQFTGLSPDDYFVEFVDGTGNYIFSPKDNSGDDTTDSDADPVSGITDPVTLMAGDSNQDVDAGLFLPAQIGNLVWNDTDGDGIKDDDEDGIQFATVSLTDEDGNAVNDIDGNLVTDATTDANGFYAFTNLLPGMYIVDFTTPVGFVPTMANTGGFDTDATDIDNDSDADPTNGESHIIDLIAGETDNRIDAGFFLPASLGDFVWNDVDGDGVQDPGDEGIDGLTVNLYAADDLATIIRTTTTGDDPSTVGTTEQGFYSFNGLPAGDFVVEFLTPGYVGSPANQGGNDLLDSDANPATGLSPVVNLTAGENNPTIDAGVYIGGSIGDLVWEDISTGLPNVYDAGIDIPVAGVNVMLLKENEAGDFVMVDQQQSSVLGYTFSDLPMGDYQVKFTAPIGFTFVAPNEGGNDAVDSDVDPATGLSPVVALGAGEMNPTIDAGLTLPPVPVELISFTGKWNKDRNVNQLDWATASEINNDYFEIERSFGNTEDFSKIAQVVGNGTTFETQNYTTDDRSIGENGIYFYRLKQLDYDGTFAYSDIIAIRVDRETVSGINVYPNPSQDFVNIEIKTEKQADIIIRLFDMTGRLIMTETVRAGDVSSNTKVRINVSDLPSGLYNIITTVGNEVFTEQIDVID